MFFFFFFQAEDGIRDLTVTGVQTCALPISAGTTRASASRTVTRTPSRANIWASSRPTALPPITTRDSGSCSNAIADALSRYPASASPGIGGAQGEEPVVTTILPAVSVRPL